MKPPEVTSTISGYTLAFKEEQIVIKVSQLRTESHQLKGSIKLILGKSAKESPAFDHNFSSNSASKSLIKSLSEKYPESKEHPEWKPEMWLEVIDNVCLQVQNLYSSGEDWSIIQPTVSGVKHPGYYIEPVIMKGVPNVIFGDPEVAKTTLALTMLGLIANEVYDSATGLVASTQARCALLDWENDKNTTDFTVSKLVQGMTIPYFELLYQRCSHPFADEIERIGNFVDAAKPEVIVLDSLGMAAGSVRFDSSGKEAALRMFEVLRQFPRVTWLIIAQNSKNEEGKKSIFGSTFYQYGARNVFQIKRSKEISKDELTIALIHEKSNFSGHYPPMGFRLTYTNSSILIESSEVSLSQFKDRIEDSEAVLEYLRLENKLCSVRDISQSIEKSDNRTRVVLSILKRKGKIINPSTGLWGLVAREDF